MIESHNVKKGCKFERFLNPDSGILKLKAFLFLKI